MGRFLGRTDERILAVTVKKKLTRAQLKARAEKAQRAFLKRAIKPEIEASIKQEKAKFLASHPRGLNMQPSENSYTVAEAAHAACRSVTWVYSRLRGGLLVQAPDSRKFTGSGGPRAVKVTKVSLNSLLSDMAFAATMAGVRRSEPVSLANESKQAVIQAASKAVPWRDRPVLTLKVAAEIVGLSVAGLYQLNAKGELHFKALGGRTLVDTQSLIALIENAPDWKTNDRGREARAKRVESRSGQEEKEA